VGYSQSQLKRNLFDWPGKVKKKVQSKDRTAIGNLQLEDKNQEKIGTKP
jgi:hypothetical protein